MSTTVARHLTSYASGPADLPLLGETIGQRLVAVALRFPDREALVDVPSGRRWTYRALDADVDRLASGLRPVTRGSSTNVVTCHGLAITMQPGVASTRG